MKNAIVGWMQPTIIETDEEFHDLCEHIRSEHLVGFDTEFVSDNTYRPALGLLQFATQNRAAVVDPLAVTDLSAWWQIMADDETTVVVHGGQAEIRFCLQFLGQPPRRLFDIQLAEGFRSSSYPLSYSAIVRRVINQRVDGSQTRTDWTRRPLSDAQLRYALEDVEYLIEICEKQTAWLEDRGRLGWAEQEVSRLIGDISDDDEAAPWERLPGIHKLSRRDLAVLQRLALWRETEASRQNRPVRRILRDDLLVDLARRQPCSEKQALATRDLNRREYRRHMQDVVDVIRAAQKIKEEDLPPKRRSRREDASSQEQVVAKLLALSLSNRCAEIDMAYTLVANNRDLLELVRYHRLGERNGDSPRMQKGWRDELFGDLLRDVMDGKVAFRVAPKGSAAPLVFE
ncbi:MAG: HRDC domain-containing protein [Fuerstiella sp.]|nr:HRDC domain-containing protein [Fuerstiella sp.]